MDVYYNHIQESNWAQERSKNMNVKERVLASRLVEKSKQNQKLAEQIGLNCKLSRMTAGDRQKPKAEINRCMMKS